MLRSCLCGVVDQELLGVGIEYQGAVCGIVIGCQGAVCGIGCQGAVWCGVVDWELLGVGIGCHGAVCGVGCQEAICGFGCHEGACLVWCCILGVAWCRHWMFGSCLMRCRLGLGVACCEFLKLKAAWCRHWKLEAAGCWF